MGRARVGPSPSRSRRRTHRDPAGSPATGSGQVDAEPAATPCARTHAHAASSPDRRWTVLQSWHLPALARRLAATWIALSPGRGSCRGDSAAARCHIARRRVGESGTFEQRAGISVCAERARNAQASRRQDFCAQAGRRAGQEPRPAGAHGSACRRRRRLPSWTVCSQPVAPTCRHSCVDAGQFPSYRVDFVQRSTPATSCCPSRTRPRGGCRISWSTTARVGDRPAEGVGAGRAIAPGTSSPADRRDASDRPDRRSSASRQAALCGRYQPFPSRLRGGKGCARLPQGGDCGALSSTNRCQQGPT